METTTLPDALIEAARMVRLLREAGVPIASVNQPGTIGRVKMEITVTDIIGLRRAGVVLGADGIEWERRDSGAVRASLLLSRPDVRVSKECTRQHLPPEVAAALFPPSTVPDRIETAIDVPGVS